MPCRVSVQTRVEAPLRHRWAHRFGSKAQHPALTRCRDAEVIMETPRIDEIARRLLESIPPGLRAMQKDLEANFRAVLRASLTKLDLVSRDEFDAQMRVLERTRARLEELDLGRNGKARHCRSSPAAVLPTASTSPSKPGGSDAVHDAGDHPQRRLHRQRQRAWRIPKFEDLPPIPITHPARARKKIRPSCLTSATRCLLGPVGCARHGGLDAPRRRHREAGRDR